MRPRVPLLLLALAAMVTACGHAPEQAPVAKAPPLDTDADGVPDSEDACPQKKGERVSDKLRNGCPPDWDDDGVVDSEDACPSLSGIRTADPKSNGCPRDSDGDGVPDVFDLCPTVAGQVSKSGKKNGCPADEDYDGVADADDACPQQAGPKNADRKINGCPPAKVVATEQEDIVFEPLYFGAREAAIAPLAADKIARIARTLTQHPEIKKLVVEGHADSKEGAAVVAGRLASQRARVVIEWLVQYGVTPARLAPEALGVSRPAAPIPSLDARQANRRVEFRIAEIVP